MTQPPNLAGGPLLEDDYRGLEARWITREIADAAFLRRVVSIDGAELVGREGRAGDYAGITIPYVWPGDENVRTYRLRRDHPDMEVGRDGKFRAAKKYLGPPGARNALYLPPQLERWFLADTRVPIVVVEGEFKTLSLWRLAWHGLGDTADQPAFVPVGIQGVYSWRGTVAKTQDEDGNRVDVKGPVPDLGRIEWSARRVIVVFDLDVNTNEGVGQARRDLTRELESRGAEVSWWQWPADVPPEQKGIDDYLAARGPDEIIRLLAKAKKVTRRRKSKATVVEAIDASDWRSKLIRTDDGGIKSNLANALTFLRNSPDLSGMIAFDEFSVRIMALKGTPWNPLSREWEEVDDILLAEWMQQQRCNVSVPIVQQAVMAVAREHKYHPVLEYIDSLVWDKKVRIDTWLHDYFGVEQSAYSRAVGARWLISAIARIRSPGCQVDHCLILKGEQGVRKSGALRTLAGAEFFTDQMPDLSDKDSSLQVQGRWIIEFSELQQLVGLRAEMETVKSYITRRVDRFRPPFERRPADFPRRCVFAGSVNLETFLADETGGRRWWVVTCNLPLVDIAKLESERDQIWAEARVRYELREPHWLDTPELLALAKEEVDKYFERDPWDEMVWAYVRAERQRWMDGGNPPGEFSISCEDVLGGALKKERSSWQMQDKRRVGRILRRHEMEYARERLYDAEGNAVLGPGGKPERRHSYRWPVTPG
jgi:predicted P-loop ATPase